MKNERAKEYSEGDDQFAQWLGAVDQIVQAKLELSLFDLEDLLLRDAFDSGDQPESFVKHTLADVVGENYGAECGDLLR